VTGLAIDLLPPEQELYSRVDWDPKGPAACNQNGVVILDLLNQLYERGVLPAWRLKYWTDPEYYNGRAKGSLLEMYRRNGNHGDEPYAHPGFLSVLRYMVEGSSLPPTLIDEYRERIGNPEWAGSSDYLEFADFARSLTRKYRLDREKAPEEFFKLTLDMRLSLWAAQTVRHGVMKAKRDRR
jgi:hypothetical protein